MLKMREKILLRHLNGSGIVRFCTEIAGFYKQNLLAWLSFVFFMLLFPGFFLYNFFVARGYFYPFLGGYFGVVAVIAFFSLAIFGGRFFFRYSGAAGVVFFFLMIWTAAVVFLNFFAGMPSGFSSEMFVWGVSGLLLNAVAFMVAINLNVESRAVYFFTLVILSFIVVFNVGDSGIFYVRQEAGDDVVDSVSTYQGFARSLVFVSILAVAGYFGGGLWFYFSALIALLALFFNGARTEFALFFLALVFVFFLYSLRSAWSVLRLFVISAFLALIAYALFDYVPESRMLQIFDIGSSSSGQARRELMEFSVDKVFSGLPSVIFGDYGAYVSLGGVGSYPHNIFSAWVNLGLFGVFIHFSLFFLLWCNAFFWYRTHSSTALYKIYIFLLFFTTAALMVSKNYSYIFVGFVVGICCQIFLKTKSGEIFGR